MKSISHLKIPSLTLRSRIRNYQKLAEEIKDQLSAHPTEWGKFQSVFNYEINGIFRQIMEFEKENLTARKEEVVYKLKKLFVNRIRKEFLHGDYIVWSLKKPYGYAGDHKIINDIYNNQPQTLGFDRLYDNYFQMSSISVAVRNRKEDFKRYIIQLLSRKNGQPVRIMNLGSGPCRELFELFSGDYGVDHSNVIVDCFDNDFNAIEYAKKMFSGITTGKINFTKENGVRLALKKNIETVIPWRFDLIYSTGLFDYFDDRVIFRLIKNLRKLLKKGGTLAISDVRDKYSNPSVHFMEWVGDWILIYRDDDSFRQLFLDAGFNKNDLKADYEQQGIMQYVYAIKGD